VQRSRDRERLPQVGRAVDVGGRMMNIQCAGSGQPAVILGSGATWALYNQPKLMFEHGAPRPGYGWVAIQRELAKSTTVCWYDRAGAGWSDPGPYPRDSASQARDLHALLQGAGVAPPYVLVSEGSAALDAHVYAGFYPTEVAGLAFVNGYHPRVLTTAGSRMQVRRWNSRPQDVVSRVMNGAGLLRLGLAKRAAPAPVPVGMTDAEWNTVWELTMSAKARAALLQDIAAFDSSADEARAAGSLGDRPLVVISAENSSPRRPVWMDLQPELSRLSSRGKLTTVAESDTDLIYRAPDAVVDAVRQVVGEIRRPTAAR
jgi:hypothetical protein